ncbi:hypothetical protein Tco_0274651, partial [Tanacetum coccineum]
MRDSLLTLDTKRKEVTWQVLQESKNGRLCLVDARAVKRYNGYDDVMSACRSGIGLAFAKKGNS